MGDVFYPLKKISQSELTVNSDNDSDFLLENIPKLLDELIPDFCSDNQNGHLTGQNVITFFKKIFAGSENYCDTMKNDPFLQLFFHTKPYIQYYSFSMQPDREYRGFINLNGTRQSQQKTTTDMKNVLQEIKDDLDEKIAAPLEESDQIEAVNIIPGDNKENSFQTTRKPSAERVISLLVNHIHTHVSILSKTKEEKARLQNIEYAEFIDNTNKQAIELPSFDPYIKAGIKTWNDELKKCLTQINNTSLSSLSYGAYPFCKLLTACNSDVVLLLIVTKLDENFLDPKVLRTEQIEPIHLIVLQSEQLNLLTRKQLDDIEYKMKYAISHLSYSVFSSSYNRNLNSIAKDANMVSKYWYSSGIEQVLSYRTIMKDKSKFGEQIVHQILCATNEKKENPKAIEGLRDLELYPFDRAYIFEGATDGNFGKTKNGSVVCKVMEAGLLSERPQDMGQFLTMIETIQEKDGIPICPDLAINFDLSKKRIETTTALSFYENEEKEIKVKSLDINDSDARQQFSEYPPTFMDIKSIEGGLSAYTGKKQQKNKISVVEHMDNLILSLFSGFSGDRAQELCQELYDNYDQDGLCFISDFGIKWKDLSCLQELEKKYYEIYIKTHMANSSRWNLSLKSIFKNNKMVSEPDKIDIEKLLNFYEMVRNQEESKVTVISFDPRLNKNYNQEFGPLETYLPTFSIILVCDMDERKSIYDLETESGDLREFFTMLIKHMVREVVTTSKSLDNKKRLFNTFMPNIIHRAKNFINEQNKKDTIDRMYNQIKRAIDSDSFSGKNMLIDSSEAVSKYLFDPFIKDLTELKNDNWSEINLISAMQTYYQSVSKQHVSKKNELIIKFHEPILPDFILVTSDEFVPESVKVILNNAIEYASLYAEENNISPQIIIDFFLSGNDSGDCKLELCIKNNSKHIYKEKLNALNNPEPQGKIGKDTKKTSSTGIGVFLSRTQLKNVIGEKADIQFQNIGKNFVEVRLILPAKIHIKDNESDDLENTDPKIIEQINPSSVSDNPYILYIEDEKEFQIQTEKALLKILPSEDHLFVCDNAMDAKGMIKNQLPLMTIMDLTFFYKSKADGAESSNGWSVLDALIQFSETQKIYRPIIILSGHDFESIESDFVEETDLKNSSYSFVKSIAQTENLLNNKTIYHSNIKDLNSPDIKIFKDAIQSYFDNNCPQALQQQDNPDKDVIQTEKEIETWPFPSANFDKQLIKYRERNLGTGSPENVLFAHANIKSIKSLFDVISKWFNHPGVPRFYPDETRNKRLYRNPTFRTIALCLCIQGEKLIDLCDLKFRYWCFIYNIIIVTDEHNIDEKLALTWKETPHGTKGLLSQNRHDVNNIFGLDSTVMAEIRDQFTEIENIFFPQFGSPGELFCWDGSLTQFKQTISNKNLNSFKKMLAERTDSCRTFPDRLVAQRLKLLAQYSDQSLIAGAIKRIHNLKFLLTI